MDLSEYGLDDLILTAIKSEVEAREVYSRLASRTKNAFMRDRMLFLSDEEDKHRAFLEKVWERNFAGRRIDLPDESPVPLPSVTLDADTPMSEVFQQAMDAEMAAREFYEGMAGMVGDDEQVKNGLEYLAAMELGHHRLLELDKKQLALMEDYETGWEMMHLGP